MRQSGYGPWRNDVGCYKNLSELVAKVYGVDGSPPVTCRLLRQRGKRGQFGGGTVELWRNDLADMAKSQIWLTEKYLDNQETIAVNRRTIRANVDLIGIQEQDIAALHERLQNAKQDAVKWRVECQQSDEALAAARENADAKEEQLRVAQPRVETIQARRETSRCCAESVASQERIDRRSL